MAEIAGIKDQKAALKRVNDNLKEVKEINEILSNIESYINDAVEKEYKLDCTFLFKDKTQKKLKFPVLIDDVSFILKSLQTYKNGIVAKIKEDSQQYHIALSPQEESSLI